MSRISGLVHFEETRGGFDGRVRKMLATLPGSNEVVVEIPGGSVGWIGQGSGPKGTAAARGDVAVAIDGYILNRSSLGLGRDGFRDDAALVAELYHKHGFPGALSRIHGDFAIALYDKTDRVLWLGRDRFGVKPLYYAEIDSRVAFASQPRALLSLPGVSSEPNHAFVARFAGSHYRTFDNAPAESPYADIRQLPAAHSIRIEQNRSAYSTPYWSLVQQEPWREDEATLAERYRELLLNSVSRRVSAAQRPVFTLSGGLDSSSVACSAVETSGDRLPAVSSVYTDPTFDERVEIQDVVQEKVSQWRAVELSDEIDLFAHVERMIRVHDEPVATATWLSHLMVCDQVSDDGFDTLFGGLGGDELNAGEYEYFPLFFADLRAAGDVDRLEQEIAAWASHHDHPVFRKDRAVASELMGRLTDPAVPGRCLPDRNRMLKYANAVSKEYYDLSAFEPVMDEPFTSYLANRTFQDMFRETLPCCLRAEDRHCTDQGISHFDPFLDHELVEFMYRVPATLKIRGGVTKQLLRKAMSGILPESTRTRIKKTGWNAPAHRWISGNTLDNLRSLVSSKSFRERGIYDIDVVIALINDHERIVTSGAYEESHMMFLWQLLNLNLWLDSLAGTESRAA